MGFIDLVKMRESCREYSDQPVSREQLYEMIETARLAPSACNIQPWRFVAVNSPSLLPDVAAALQGMGMNRFTSNVPAFIIICENSMNLAETAADVVSGRRFAMNDIGIAAAHIILAAKTQGLDTCILGWFNEKKLRNILDIPMNHRVRLVIAVGYALNQDAMPREKRRKDMDEIARFI